MIIKLSNSDIPITDIDKILKDSHDQTEAINAIIMNSSDFLDGHSIFTSILRAVKRGQSLDKAVESYCSYSCPPADNDDCDENCKECWKCFIKNYSDIVLNKEDKKRRKK